MGRRREEVKALRREEFQWRCAYGRHAYPSRTRELRHKRPMVLYWRRYGRVGGCWIIKKKLNELSLTIRKFVLKMNFMVSL